MQCKILAIDEQIYQGEIEQLIVWTKEGQVTILAHHEPCLLLLASGELMLKSVDQSQSINRFIGGGFLEVKDNNEVLVLADSAENLEEWSSEEAELAKQRAEQAVVEATTEESLVYAKAQLAKSLARLNIVHRKYKKRY